jgi:hypothetical protein
MRAGTSHQVFIRAESKDGKWLAATADLGQFLGTTIRTRSSYA